ARTVRGVARAATLQLPRSAIRPVQPVPHAVSCSVASSLSHAWNTTPLRLSVWDAGSAATEWAMEGTRRTGSAAPPAARLAPVAGQALRRLDPARWDPRDAGALWRPRAPGQ